MKFCGKCRNGWLKTDDELWYPCRCVLEAEFRAKCHHPDAGFDDIPTPTKDQLIIGKQDVVDKRVNSIVRSHCKANRDVQVLHIEANILTDEVLTFHDLDTTWHSVMFITMSSSGSAMGRAIAIGQVLDKRQFLGLPTHLLLVGEARGTMLRRYADMGNGFQKQLSDLQTVVLECGEEVNTSQLTPPNLLPDNFDPSSAI